MTQEQVNERGMIFTLLVVFLAGMMLAGCSRKYLAGVDCSPKTSNIVGIGGCNAAGVCGVQLVDGTFTDVHLPAPGEPITYSPCEDRIQR